MAFMALVLITTSCKKEEPKPETPTHLGVWELTSVREVYFTNNKISWEEISYFDPAEDAMERLHFKDASNGDIIVVYPNNEEPQETYPFTYKIEGSKLTISDSDGDYVFEELNIQAQTLTLGIYEEGSATNPDRLLRYLKYKRI